MGRAAPMTECRNASSELAQMMADGTQSSAKRQIRLLVPQSDAGPPIATPTRLCERARRASDFRYAKPRKAGRKALLRLFWVADDMQIARRRDRYPLWAETPLVARVERSRTRARSASADRPR